MKLNDEILKSTVAQINQMQDAIRETARQITGSQDYIAKQMQIFKDNESINQAQRAIEKQRELIAKSFFDHDPIIQNAAIEVDRLNKQLGLDVKNSRIKRLIKSMEIDKTLKISKKIIDLKKKTNDKDEEI